jgi:peptide/nickel transport system substrate-binding protein
VEFYRSAYELVVEDARAVTLRFDKVNFDYASAADFQPLPAHIERARWEADPRGYRNRTAYDTETATPGLWSGPYRISAVQPGAGVTLDRNDAWAGPAPAFRRIQIRAVENTAALEAQLLAGQLDMVAGELGLPVEQAAALERRAGGRFAVFYKPGLVFEHLDLQHDHPALGDKRVRQALMLATDRAQIVARLFEGRQTVAHSAVNPLDRMHDADTRQWPHDPARAAALLDEAGWRRGPDGVRRNAAGEKLSFELMTRPATGRGKRCSRCSRACGARPASRRASGTSRRGCCSGRRCRAGAYRGWRSIAWISGPENVPRSTLHSDEIPRAERNWSGQNFGGLAQRGDGRLGGGAAAGAGRGDAAGACGRGSRRSTRRSCPPCRCGSAPTRTCGRAGWTACGRPGTSTRPRSGWRSGGALSGAPAPPV